MLDPPGARRRAARLFYRRAMQRVRRHAPTARVNRTLFTAVSEPGALIWVRPDDIKRAAADDVNLYENEILPGDWDRHTTALDGSKRFRSVVQHFRDGVAWEETDFFRDKPSRFEQGRSVRGMRTFEELKRHYETHVEDIYESIRQRGFLVRNVPHVHVARDGEVLFGGRAIERLAMAKVLAVDRIPCRVRTRHLAWQLQRERVVACEPERRREMIGATLAAHPDMADLLGSPSKATASDLYRVADQMPSMGGTRLGSVLRELARDAPAETSIVEVGSWLGAGTAQLALGIRERSRPDSVSLHCYDRWTATRMEVLKAARWGLRLSVGDDTLPWVRRALEPFEVPVTFHQGDLLESCWKGGAISVYVDDASKMPDLFLSALLTFGTSWIPGKTVIVLMDYDIWQRTKEADHQCQKSFIESNSDSFARLRHPGHAVFRYRAPIDFGKVSIEFLSMKLRQREREVEEIKDSTSWRVTAPLRRCADVARGSFISAASR